MPGIRFGQFTTGQQRRLDLLTGGKPFRTVVLDTFAPMSLAETQSFNRTHSNIQGQMWPLNWVSPSVAETLGGPMLNSFLDGSAQQGLYDVLAKTPDPTKQRQILQEGAASAVAVIEFMEQWSQIPTDRTFDALEKMVELMKNVLKF